MDVQLVSKLFGRKKDLWIRFLQQAGLEPDLRTDSTVLIFEEEQLVATGSRLGNLLKCIAVDESFQGMGLTATLMTHLRQDAFAAGHKHLFLYTKPKNLLQFSSLFFYPVAQTEDVLLMENEPNGIQKFLNTLPVPHGGGQVAGLVMNCNPFTLGHRYLIETAARECDWVHVFVLSEEQPPFPAADRLALVREGTCDLPNVTVLPTGPYLLSAATFPTYFLPNRDDATQIQCLLDIAVFEKYYIPKFGITVRYVGTEPLSPMTGQYNDALRTHLSVPLREISRKEWDSQPISASKVRALMQAGQTEALQSLVPTCTFQYLIQHSKES